MLRVQFQPKSHPISLLYTDLCFDDLNLTKGAMVFDEISAQGLELLPEFVSKEEQDHLMQNIEENE